MYFLSRDLIDWLGTQWLSVGRKILVDQTAKSLDYEKIYVEALLLYTETSIVFTQITSKKIYKEIIFK